MSRVKCWGDGWQLNESEVLRTLFWLHIENGPFLTIDLTDGLEHGKAIAIGRRLRRWAQECNPAWPLYVLINGDTL